MRLTADACLAMRLAGVVARSTASHLLPARRSVAILSAPAAALRSRQRAALQDLEKCLVQLDAPEEHTQVLRESITLLDSLFLCCVVGEFNAGKSALLNALLGTSSCAEGVLPTTDTVTLIKHPDVAFEPSHATFGGSGGAAGVAVVDVPLEWLRDLHLVDTPGTNSIDAAHTALTEGFLPRADLVVFVTSAERPFSQSEQAFLRGVARWRKPTLCVLNKADVLPTAPQLAAVTEYVASNAHAVLQQPPGSVPVLPVSARTAQLLKERRDASSAIAAAAASSSSPIQGEVAPAASSAAAELGAPLSGVAATAEEGVAAAQWEAFETEIRRVLRRAGTLKMESQVLLPLPSRCLTRLTDWLTD